MENLKTIVRISNDFFGNTSDTFKVEDINYLVNEINVFCETKNRNFRNIIEEEKRYHSEKEDYKNKIIVNAKGYSQGDWQDYILYYNEKELKTPKDRMYFSDIVKHLERTFTHQNDYIAEKFERTEINGKIFNSDPYDYTSFCVNNTEFPQEKEIIDEYISIYGKDFNQCIININN